MGNPSYFGLTGSSLAVLQISLIVAPSFILFGYNQAVLGGLLTETGWTARFPAIDTVHTTSTAEKSAKSTIQGLVVATFTLGAIFGSLSAAWSGDKFGRRNVIFFSALCTLVGEALETSAFSLAQLIVGRVAIGAGVGQLTSIVPVWLSETAGSANRGRQVVLTGLFICVGYVFESWLDLAFFEIKSGGDVTWRPPIGIAMLFSIILMASVYLLPESPRWLVLKGRSEDARGVLAALRGHDRDAAEVATELSGIEYSLEETKQGGAKLGDILTNGEEKLLYRFMLCIVLQFFQQMSGTNLVSVYATILFQTNLGMSSELSRILSAGMLTWKFLSSFLAFFTIDRFGRRAVFMFSGCGLTACMVSLAVATSFPSSNYAAQIAAACFLYLYCFFVPIGFLGANFLYCTEVAPIRLRMAMSSISTANHWTWNFLVLMITPVALNTIGSRYYIVYAAICACIPVTVYFFFPETKGRNLEELDLLFKESPSVFATVRFAQKQPVAMPLDYKKAEEKLADHAETQSSSSK